MGGLTCLQKGGQGLSSDSAVPSVPVGCRWEEVHPLCVCIPWHGPVLGPWPCSLLLGAGRGAAGAAGQFAGLCLSECLQRYLPALFKLGGCPGAHLQLLYVSMYMESKAGDGSV